MLLLFTVSGEANFSMALINLTVGGFTQPGVARALIDVSANTKKGLSEHFLWLFPTPLYKHIEALTEVDRDFMQKMSEWCQIWFESTLPSIIHCMSCNMALMHVWQSLQPFSPGSRIFVLVLTFSTCFVNK